MHVAWQVSDTNLQPAGSGTFRFTVANDPVATTGPPTTAAPSTTVAPQVETQEVAGGPTPETGFLGGVPLLARAGLGLAVLVVLGVAYVGLVLWLKRERLSRRRHHAGDASSRVRVAWLESVEGLEVLGTRPEAAETHEEFARRAGTRLPATGTALLELAHDADAAAYAPDLLTEDVAARADDASGANSEEARTLAGPVARWLHLLDPRPLLPRIGLANRHRAESARG